MGDGTSAEITSIENTDLGEQVVYFEGDRLTEARAAAIARDIAARHGRKGADRDWLPKRAGSGSGCPVISRPVRVGRSAAGVSDSELAREATDQYLAQGA